MSLEDRLYPMLRSYQGLPRGIQSMLGAGYRCLPESWRLGTRYGEFRRLTADTERWSADELRHFQLKQLRVVLHHAANYCSFYRKRFTKAGFRPEDLRELDDLRHCPTIEKRELIDNINEMVSTQFKRSDRLYITTGGSTGVPVGFYLHKGVSRPKEHAYLEAMWRRAGYFKGARLVVIRGHVTSDRAHGRIVDYDATRDWLMLSAYHLTVERLPEYLEATARFKPDLLHAYPSAALHLAELLERARKAWPWPIRGLLAGSERLTLPQKRLLERVFQCRVYRWYGHSERVVLAGEGCKSELYYFWPTYGFVEFGPPNDEGLCEVIGTSFHNLTMPLIRYRTGDYVRLADPRIDGELEYPWPAASAVDGREQEFLISRNGRRISLTAVNMHDDIFDDLYAVQFYQIERGKAEFRYVPGPRFSSKRLPQIEAGIRHKLGSDFELELRAVNNVEKTDRGKHRWLVSRISQNGS